MTQTLVPDLFSFAYVPCWYTQLDTLAGCVLPEPWCFNNPAFQTKNLQTPILERYIQSVFRKQAIDYNHEYDAGKCDRYFYVRNENACFHTGLYTERYKAIYGYFERNKRLDPPCHGC